MTRWEDGGCLAHPQHCRLVGLTIGPWVEDYVVDGTCMAIAPWPTQTRALVYDCWLLLKAWKALQAGLRSELIAGGIDLALRSGNGQRLPIYHATLAQLMSELVRPLGDGSSNKQRGKLLLLACRMRRPGSVLRNFALRTANAFYAEVYGIWPGCQAHHSIVAGQEAFHAP